MHARVLMPLMKGAVRSLRYGQTHRFHYNTENIPRRLVVSAMKLIMVFSLVQSTCTWTRKR